MVWSKSWMFFKSTPEPQEGKAPPSNWGNSWQFLNLQPHIEGQHWTEHNGPQMESHSLWQKPKKMMDVEHFEEGLPVPEWEKSWKYTKPKTTQKSDTKDEANKEAGAPYSKIRKLDMLVESQHHNEALSSSEWNTSWMSTKPPSDGHAHTDVPPVSEPNNNQKKDGKSGSQCIECWKFMNHQLHVKNNSNQTSSSPEWGNSWRAATIVSNNNKKVTSPELAVYGNTQDSNHHKVILFVSREHKYRDLWSSQLCDEDKPLSEWDKSWETAKNLSEPSAEDFLKAEESPVSQKAVVNTPIKKEENKERVQQSMHNKTIWTKTAKDRNLVSPHFMLNLPQEWNEAWKFPKSGSHKETEQWLTTGMPDASMVLKQHMKKRSLTDWSESWKCARPYSCHGKPSVTEWKQSWFSRYQPHAGREHWIKEAGLKEHAMHHPKYEVFNLPKRSTTEKMLHQMGDMEKGMLTTEWNVSWKTLKREDQPNTVSTSKWGDSWRCAAFHTSSSGEEQPTQNWSDESMEIQPRKEKLQEQGAMIRISRSFDSQIFKERYPQTLWVESWKAATLQKHHQRSHSVKDQSKFSRFHLNDTMASIPEWKNSWKFVCIQFNQRKEFWDGEEDNNTMDASPDVKSNESIKINVPSQITSNNKSKWGKSWKIANPMPHIEQGSWLQSHTNPSQYVVLWTRSHSMKLPDTSLKETTTLNVWGKSWSFLKMEIKDVSKAGKRKSNGSNGGLVIMTKKIKQRKHIYSSIDKDKPAERRWTDNYKLAKTQPRPKREVFLKIPKGEKKGNGEFTQQWAESWKFSYQPEKQNMAEVSTTVSIWGESWKFLIPYYPPQKEPKTK